VIRDWFRNRESTLVAMVTALWLLFSDCCVMMYRCVRYVDPYVLSHDPRFDGTLLRTLVYELKCMVPDLIFGIDRVMVLHDESSQDKFRYVVHWSTRKVRSVIYGCEGVIPVHDADLSSLKPPEIIIQTLESLEQDDSDTSVRRSARRALEAINPERLPGEVRNDST
jgi:hypothetical protein